MQSFVWIWERMKKYKWVLIILFVLIIGCKTLETKIIMADGRVFVIENKSDGMVKVKIDGIEILVDNKKPLGVIQSLMGLAVTNTRVNLTNAETNSPGRGR
jgi:hypothetical protein